MRAALRALPHVGPGRSLGFVTLPAGQDPDDLIRAGGRAALEALLETPEPLVDRLWRHELAAEPLATPEQSAGLQAPAHRPCRGDRTTPTCATNIAPNCSGDSTS